MQKGSAPGGNRSALATQELGGRNTPTAHEGVLLVNGTTNRIWEATLDAATKEQVVTLLSGLFEFAPPVAITLGRLVRQAWPGFREA